MLHAHAHSTMSLCIGDVSLDDVAKFAKGLYDKAVECAADPMHSSCCKE